MSKTVWAISSVDKGRRFHHAFFNEGEDRSLNTVENDSLYHKFSIHSTTYLIIDYEQFVITTRMNNWGIF